MAEQKAPTPEMLSSEHSMTANRARILDLKKGGQDGPMMDPVEIENAAAYAKQKLIPVVIRVPDAMQYLPNSEDWIAALVELMTTQMTRIEGINRSVTREYDTKNIGQAGEQLETLTRAQREKSNPSYTWYGRYNDSVTRFWTELNRLILKDPDTQVPGLLSLQSYRDAGSPALMPHMQGLTMMFIEPNTEWTDPVHAVMFTNMQAKSDGEITMRYESHYNAEVPETTIEFTALAMPPSSTVLNMARNYLKSLNLANLRPNDSKAFYDKIASPDVEAAKNQFINKLDAVVGAGV